MFQKSIEPVNTDEQSHGHGRANRCSEDAKLAKASERLEDCTRIASLFARANMERDTSEMSWLRSSKDRRERADRTRNVMSGRPP